MTSPFLTPRQQQVADLVAAGLTDKAIAATLQLSQGRVSRLVWKVARKIGCDTTRDIRVQIALSVRRVA